MREAIIVILLTAKYTKESRAIGPPGMGSAVFEANTTTTKPTVTLKMAEPTMVPKPISVRVVRVL